MRKQIGSGHGRCQVGCIANGRHFIAKISARNNRASNHAVEVMGQRGLDLTGHSSQPMTEQILQLADFILTMTRNHRDAILSKFPEVADRVHTLRVDGGDISDPVGSSLEVYQACADQIDEQLAIWVDRFRDQIQVP